MITTDTKTCTRCREDLPLENFPNCGWPYQHKKQSHCRSCQAQNKRASFLKSQQKRFKKKQEASQKREEWKKRTQKAVETGLLCRTDKDTKSQTKPRQKPRKRQIRPISQSRGRWLALYKAKHESDPEIVTGYGILLHNDDPTIFPIRDNKVKFERHHCGRRYRWLHLWYAYVTPALHHWIEHNSHKARELGLLFTVQVGHLVNPSPHDPLNALAEFKELQDKYLFI